MRPSPLNPPELLRRYGLRPDKRLGQNFLVDEVALQQVVQAAAIRTEDIVLEIGAGLGGLTRWLAIQAKRVVAVELDDKLIPPLREVLAPYSNTQVIQGDILALNPTELIREENGTPQPPYLVVANIPYYITSALIRHLLEASHPPKRLVLTLQFEVAKRMASQR
jgi:16S rRNA (adenine1518-N6/adenine1519-N6)-dimethyltransferase